MDFISSSSYAVSEKEVSHCVQTIVASNICMSRLQDTMSAPLMGIGYLSEPTSTATPSTTSSSLSTSNHATGPTYIATLPVPTPSPWPTPFRASRPNNNATKFFADATSQPISVARPTATPQSQGVVVAAETSSSSTEQFSQSVTPSSSASSTTARIAGATVGGVLVAAAALLFVGSVRRRHHAVETSKENASKIMIASTTSEDKSVSKTAPADRDIVNHDASPFQRFHAQVSGGFRDLDQDGESNLQDKELTWSAHTKWKRESSSLSSSRSRRLADGMAVMSSDEQSLAPSCRLVFEANLEQAAAATAAASARTSSWKQPHETIVCDTTKDPNTEDGFEAVYFYAPPTVRDGPDETGSSGLLFAPGRRVSSVKHIDPLYIPYDYVLSNSGSEQ